MTSTSVAFDQAADYYDETRGFPMGIDRQIGAFIAQQVGFTAQTRLLEIGVGTGRLALPVAEHTGLFVGVDLAVPMMNKLRQKQAADFPNTHLTAVQGDVMHLPFADQTFDAALVVHILHLVADMGRTISELMRVMQRGGKIVQCWNQDNRQAFAPLWSAWDGVTNWNDNPKQDRWKHTLTAFDDAGWVRSAEHVFPFTVQQSPHTIVDRYRRRVYSHMWTMPDEVWQRGVERVETALHAEYPDPHQVFEVQHEFHICVYTAP